LPIKNVFREDRLRDSLPRDKAMQNAPDKNDGFYRVPRIIE
jgi:aspartyl-tRNA(Asn)/glutamyl-tRNA(Gln) amidotransferase subunit C